SEDGNASEKPTQKEILVAHKSEVVQPIINTARPKKPVKPKDAAVAKQFYYHLSSFTPDAKNENESSSVASGLMNVNYQSIEVPQLKQYQEAEVKQALILTKKVL